jgi:cell division cycle 20-like protein 1 (cofactor of APC complex)
MKICNLAFSTHSNEFVTTHGFSGNQIMVWNLSTLQRIAVLDGHINRVLHLSTSPDGENIATAAADQTLKFWKVFPRSGLSEQEPTPQLLMQLR